MAIDLFQHRKNVYSQNGEDGILAELLRALKLDQGYFVEFGAWDGKHWSNSYHLYEKGWHGCFIEADGERYRQLCENIPDEKVVKIHSLVEESGDNSLDNILQRHAIEAVDLLSIDIDSDDLRVWEGVGAYRPTVVVIEYNSVIPFDTRYVNPKGKMYGNSALSIVESATTRGYLLVEGTDTNLIFVRADAVNEPPFKTKTLQDVRDQTYQLRFFFGYDGTLLHDFETLNEHGVSEFYPVPFAMTMGCQPIPAPFRKVRDRMNYAGLVFFGFSALVRSPLSFIKLIGAACRIVLKDRTPMEFVRVVKNKNDLTRSLKEK
ncbi:MAG: hypothetical protein HOA30_02225 [Rhodospirillaceae bacterium]|jgi:hypothetical protein|nr:hypothetical protein [Rhodospirillaceae bacterium]MBT3908708.1 hypothetical protein [Rhodospirillaceae bacterium]MBT5298498.1 hypothetical protein [Rhodospirillaceae bacterium]MBT5513360.1 hypothetical protein [Rhodospirillaceae bacterium]MBT6087625.1 hypothetical protein [Rhodospirillaceae bacterium]